MTRREYKYRLRKKASYIFNAILDSRFTPEERKYWENAVRDAPWMPYEEWLETKEQKRVCHNEVCKEHGVDPIFMMPLNEN
jgi:hypothetical protein